MKTFITNNNLKERFDFYSWSAPLFDTPEDVAEYIESLTFQNKILFRINIIGDTYCRMNNSYLYEKITEAGIKLEDDWYYTYNKDNIMIPWSIMICEPIQLIFNDETSLEFLPTNNGGARIGINSIPQNISDGLNLSNFDASLFFRELPRISFSEFSLCIEKREYAAKPFLPKNAQYIYQFIFGFHYKIILNHDGRNGYYVVEIQRYAESTSNIPYAIASTSIKDVRQIKIINGPCGSDMFNIQPIKMNKPIEENWQLDRYGISICEDDVEEFLGVFLKRHYDPTVQKGYRQSANLEFAWYDESLFTFEAIRKIIADIRNECSLLLTDYDKSELKNATAYYTWIPDTLQYEPNWASIKKEELQKYRISVAIDFYERFCTQLENMMSLPDKDYGP